MTIRVALRISTALFLSFFVCTSFGQKVERSKKASQSSDYVRKAAESAESRNSKDAIKWATLAIETDPTNSIAFYLRGRERLRAGDFQESLSDFDSYLELRPDRASRLWERGIACYYAREFQKGADQFESYQTYHGNDVENAVWHVICLAQVIGFKPAQERIMFIRADSRVPMMDIYRLFRGDTAPDQVMAAARAGNPAPRQLNDRLMYAHLYLGLYFEARGEKDKSLQHVKAAANDHRNSNYMWDVARVHFESRSDKSERKVPK